MTGEDTQALVSETLTQNGNSKHAESERKTVEFPTDDNVVNYSEKRSMTLMHNTEEDDEVSEILQSEDNEVSYMW